MVDDESAKASLRAMLERHWPTPDFPALLAESRAAWNKDEIWTLWAAMMFTVPVMSDVALPGGELPASGPQALIVEPTDESLAPLGDRRRALLVVQDVVQLTTAAAAMDPRTRDVLRRVGGEHKGKAVYVLLVVALSMLASLDGSMPGAGDVTLRRGLADVDALPTPT